MSFALLQTALLLPVEALLNGVLALGAAAPRRLAAMEGQTLSVLATEPAVSMHISIRNHKLRLSPLFEGTATATLRGPARQLANLLLQDTTPASLAPFGVELQGSTAFMQQLQLLLRDLDVDWEFHLSRFVGDLPVSAAAGTLQRSRSFVRNTADAARHNIDDYLVHESGLFPARSEVERFRAALLDLGLRIDRAQARLDQLAG